MLLLAYSNCFEIIGVAFFQDGFGTAYSSQKVSMLFYEVLP